MTAPPEESWSDKDLNDAFESIININKALVERVESLEYKMRVLEANHESLRIRSGGTIR